MTSEQLTSDRYCFCELAPLYSFDLLSEPERQWVEQQVAGCPELADELAEDQAVVAEIPYSAPVVPMAAGLKDRLFERLDLEPLGSPYAPALTEDASLLSFLAVRSQDRQWQPDSVPGVEISIFHTDSINRQIVGLLRAKPGVRYPRHRHATVEEIYMLSGDLTVGGEVYGAGDYIRSQPGSTHAPHTLDGCMFFFRASMDDEYAEFASVEA